MVKNLPTMQETVCNARDAGLIPESGRSPGEGNDNHLTILAWEMPWTEEPGGLRSMGLPIVGHNLATKTTAAQEHKRDPASLHKCGLFLLFTHM